MPKQMLVFDCQEMPVDVKSYFFAHYGEGKSNDVYITVWVEGNCEIANCQDDFKCETCQLRKYDIVEQWLLDNGSGDDEVIVKRWW